MQRIETKRILGMIGLAIGLALAATGCTVAPYDGSSHSTPEIDFRGGATGPGMRISIQARTSQGTWETVGQATSSHQLLAGAGTFTGSPDFYRWDAPDVNPFVTRADGFRPTARVRVLHEGFGSPIPAFRSSNEIVCMMQSGLVYYNAYRDCTNGGIEELTLYTTWRPTPQTGGTCGDGTWDSTAEACDGSARNGVPDGGYCTDACVFVAH